MSQGKMEIRAELLVGQNSVVARQWNGYKKVFMCFSIIFSCLTLLLKTLLHIVYNPRQIPSCTKVVLETRTAVWSNWRCEGSQGSRATLSTKLRGIVRSSKGGFAVRPLRQVLQLALLGAYYAFSISLMETKTLSAPNIFWAIMASAATSARARAH